MVIKDAASIDEKIKSTLTGSKSTTPPSKAADKKAYNEEKALEDLAISSTKILTYIDACTLEKRVSIYAKIIAGIFAILMVFIVYYKTICLIHSFGKIYHLNSLDYRVMIAIVVSSFVFCLGILGITLRGIFNWGRRIEKDNDDILPENFKAVLDVAKNLGK